MAMFKKRNRKNLRVRKADDDEEQQTEEEKEHNPLSIAAPAISQPSSRKVEKPSTGKTSVGILSFDDEMNDEGVGFKIKKSSLSEKMKRQREKQKWKEKQLEEEEVVMEVVDEPDIEEEEEPVRGGVVPIGRHLETGMVPDATMIHAIRKKREKARELGVPSVDYLPLDSTATGGKKGYGKATGKSRLIREDDNDMSDEENDTTVMNFGKTNEPAKHLQVLSGLENLSDSEDEETKRWEEEQISKGIKASAQQEHTVDEQYQSVNHYPSMDALTQSFIYGQYHPGYEGKVPPSTFKPHPQQPIIPEKLVPITLESVKSRLVNKLEDIKDTHLHHSRQIEQVEKDIDTAKNEISKMEVNFPTMEGQYAFFQQMRSYVRDLLSCLAIKNAHIKVLDKKMMDVRRKRAELLIERRRQDVVDEAEECAAGGKGINIGPEVEARQRRSVEREARRRRKREKRQKEGITNHSEGLSSDDELLETNRLKFISDSDSVNDKAKDVFSDVVDDFHRLFVIKTRFEQWKFTYTDTYTQAFVPMCLPKLFAPFVTLQMINWNPLESSDAMSFDRMKWFQVLLFYGYQQDELPSVTDEDNLLIPLIIDKVVLSKLTDLVETVWDPLSTTQSKNLATITNELLSEYSTSHTPQQDDLLTAINKRMREAINRDVFIPLMSSIQLQNNNTHDYIFYQRQFWSCIKLLSNILLWRNILPDLAIQQLVLDGLVSRYLLLSLQNSPADKLTVAKLETLFSLLPSEWLDEQTVTKSRPLQGLKRFLVNLVETLKREGMAQYNDHIKKINRGLEERVKLIQERFNKVY